MGLGEMLSSSVVLIHAINVRNFEFIKENSTKGNPFFSLRYASYIIHIYDGLDWTL